MERDMEVVFDRFLESEECDMLHGSLQEVVHAAFVAGWNAAAQNEKNKFTTVGTSQVDVPS